MSELEDKMEYAIRLAEPEASLVWEEVFKLASLCEEIAKLLEREDVAQSELAAQFEDRIRQYYRHSGSFRQEVERFALAKMLVSNFQSSSDQH